MKRWLALFRAVVCAAAAGCAVLACGSAAAEPAHPDACHAALASRFIKARATPTLRRTIEAIARPRRIRWIALGQPITLDYDPARLNVILSEAGRITAMRCG